MATIETPSPRAVIPNETAAKLAHDARHIMRSDTARWTATRAIHRALGNDHDHSEENIKMVRSELEKLPELFPRKEFISWGT